MGKVLSLKAKHFVGTAFFGAGNCAIEKAAIDQYGTTAVNECVFTLIMDGRRYNHEAYKEEDFKEDQLKADDSKSNVVIRKIALVEQKSNQDD